MHTRNITQHSSTSKSVHHKKKPRLSHSQPVSHLNLCLLLNLFSNASDALRAARADGRHYVPLSLNRLGRVINTHGDILVSNAYEYSQAQIELASSDRDPPTCAQMTKRGDLLRLRVRVRAEAAKLELEPSTLCISL